MDLQPNILRHFDCVAVPDCVFFVRLFLLHRRITTWSADREGWLNRKLCVLLLFFLSATTLTTFFLSSVCSTSLFVLGCDCLCFKPHSTFQVFFRVAVRVILSVRPAIFYLLLLFIFPFGVVLGTSCCFYFIILFVPTQYIFLTSIFVLNHC